MLCERRFFVALFEALTWYRGDVARLGRDFRRRAQAFEPEWDRDYRLGLPDRESEDIQRVLGFRIGERWPVLPSPLPPALPLPGWPVADPATTGPP